MAVPTINVIGKVVTPSGAGVAGGSLLVRLLHPGHVDDGGTEQIVGGVERFVIELDGSVDFELVPTDAISTHDGGAAVYKVTFKDTEGDRWTQFWILEAAGPDPIDIGDIEVVQTINGVPIPELSKIPDVDTTGANDGDVLAYNAATGMWEAGPQTGGGGGGSLTSLSDTDLSGLTNYDYLRYNSVAAKWENKQLELPEWTTATRPAAIAGNKGKAIILQDPGVPGVAQVLLYDGVSAYGWVDIGAGA